MNLEASLNSAYTCQVLPGGAPLFIYIPYLLCHVILKLAVMSVGVLVGSSLACNY